MQDQDGDADAMLCFFLTGTRSINTVHPVVVKTPNGAMAGSESYGDIFGYKLFLLQNARRILKVECDNAQHTIHLMARIKPRTAVDWSLAILQGVLSRISWLGGV